MNPLERKNFVKIKNRARRRIFEIFTFFLSFAISTHIRVHVDALCLWIRPHYRYFSLGRRQNVIFWHRVVNDVRILEKLEKSREIIQVVSRKSFGWTFFSMRNFWQGQKFVPAYSTRSFRGSWQNWVSRPARDASIWSLIHK